jgi:hypothetical protein
MRSDPVLIDPRTILTAICGTCVIWGLELAAGTSVQRGRKNEKSGEVACAGSDELYSCRKPDGVRTK